MENHHKVRSFLCLSFHDNFLICEYLTLHPKFSLQYIMLPLHLFYHTILIIIHHYNIIKLHSNSLHLDKAHLFMLYEEKSNILWKDTMLFSVILVINYSYFSTEASLLGIVIAILTYPVMLCYNFPQES